MEQLFFSIAGILIISTVLWFGFSLYRVRRSPEAVMEHWQKLTPADLQRLSQLCEMFFKDELQLSLNRKNPAAVFAACGFACGMAQTVLD